MRVATRVLRRSIAVFALLAVVVVLFPNYTEPLWDWARTITGAVGYESLPSFGDVQGVSGMGLLAVVLGGLAYNTWRDRKHEVLQAEYAYQTGANNLKKKVGELETQVKRMAADRDKWQEAYMALNRQHTQALVTAKEHEVRSEFGKQDREALKELRQHFEEVVKEKGHMEGFREAMHLFMSNAAEAAAIPNISVHAAECPIENGRDGRNGRPKLPQRPLV